MLYNTPKEVTSKYLFQFKFKFKFGWFPLINTITVALKWTGGAVNILYRFAQARMQISSSRKQVSWGLPKISREKCSDSKIVAFA